MNFPPIPDADADQHPPERVSVRYEDITQDGRLILEAFPTAIGEVLWRRLVAKHPVAAAMRGTGLLPILTRMVSEGERGPMSVGGELLARGAMQLAHSVSQEGDRAGEVDRIFLNMWAELTAPIGRTHGPAPERAGERVVVGRIFAEHVFTRPFAPPAERKVLRLDFPGVPAIPPVRYQGAPLPTLLDLPDGAEPLDAELALDPSPVAFGLCHTDSNQHVNSLVYPRMFEEAALRRFATLGRSTVTLARSLEIGYRKPAFAGQTMRIALRAFELGGRLGAVGAFVRDDDVAQDPSLAATRPHCFVRMIFDA